MNGFKKCPAWLRRRYLTEAKNTCKITGKIFPDSELEIHRIIRGNMGGLYTVCPLFSKESNVQVVCSKIHKKLHENEKGCRGR